MGETKLNFLLMGKTGEGKSATGNMILGRRAFKTSLNVVSETKDVTFSFAHFDNYEILVVDGPGLEDTNLDQLKDKTAAVQNMEKAVSMCYGGVDGFLLVIKSGSKFTEANKQTLDSLQRIFGQEFINYVIVVVTCGDIFENGMIEDEQPDKSFHEWCMNQTDPVFKRLYKECEKRFVLFNNWEKGEGRKRAQILELIQLARDLQKRSGRYTSQCFTEAEQGREKMILELNAPQLREEFQQKMCFLIADIENLSEHSSIEAMEQVRSRVRDVSSEIDQHDQGHDVFREIKDLMTALEERRVNKSELNALSKRLERIREAKKEWAVIGAVGTAVGVCITGTGPLGLAVTVGGAITAGVAVGSAALPVGLFVAGVSAVAAGLGYLNLRHEKREIEKKMNK